MKKIFISVSLILFIVLAFFVQVGPIGDPEGALMTEKTELSLSGVKVDKQYGNQIIKANQNILNFDETTAWVGDEKLDLEMGSELNKLYIRHGSYGARSGLSFHTQFG